MSISLCYSGMSNEKKTIINDIHLLLHMTQARRNEKNSGGAGSLSKNVGQLG